MDFNIITSAISSGYASAQEFLFSNLVAPVLYQLGLMSWAEDVFDGIDWFLFDCIQIFLIVTVLRTWKRLAPAEKQEGFVRSNRADVFYTLFHRLGIFHGLIFISLSGFFFEIDSILHDFRFDRLNVESWWPGVTSIPVVSFFLIYLVLLQTVMTAWSDNRNHILDDIMRATFMTFFALLFGVSPGQFIMLIALSQFIQSWQHANIKSHLGPAKYLLISPIFHRMHHAVGYGHEAKGKPGVFGGL